MTYRSRPVLAGPFLRVFLAAAGSAGVQNSVGACSNIECAPRETRSAALIQVRDNVTVSNKPSHHSEAARLVLAVSKDLSNLSKRSKSSGKNLNLMVSSHGSPQLAPAQTLPDISLWQRIIDNALVVKALCLPLLTLFCLGYELLLRVRGGGGKKDVPANAAQLPKKPRLPLWDIMRFSLELLVIYKHMATSWMEPGTSFQDQVESAGRPIRMAGFAVISGVFGASMAADSISKMFCYTLGTNALAAAFYFCTFEYYPVHLWYLKSLLVWRLSLTPLFHLFAQFEVPSAAPMLISYVLLYFARHLQLAEQFGIPGDTTWYGIFFAVGLLFSAGTWTKVMLHRGALAVAVLVLASYYSTWCLTPSDPWLNAAHAPRWVHEAPISINGFIEDTVLACVQSSLALAALVIIAHASTLFSQIAPDSCDFVAGCGSRTLYAYVLHMWLKAGMAQTFPKLYELTQAPHSILWAIVLTLWLNVVLCMRGSELLFRWMLLPYWMLDIKDRLVHTIVKSPDDKAAD